MSWVSKKFTGLLYDRKDDSQKLNAGLSVTHFFDYNTGLLYDRKDDSQKLNGNNFFLSTIGYNTFISKENNKLISTEERILKGKLTVNYVFLQISSLPIGLIILCPVG